MNFDVLAPHYRWMEFVLAGDKLQRCRTAFLHHATHYQDVLLMGEGNGRFLLECRRALENARITCVDLSPRMLTLARKRLHDSASNLAGVEFIRADALAWTPPVQAFDLVVTHFFLDCFTPEQLQRVIEALAIGAKPKATWLLADFSDSVRWIEEISRPLYSSAHVSLLPYCHSSASAEPDAPRRSPQDARFCPS